MLAWENSGFSFDASVRVALVDRGVPSYFKSLEHLLRYCARPAVTALAIGNLGTRANATSSLPRPPGEGRGEGARHHEQARSHDTSRIAWAKLIARIAEDFPQACPACGGDIRLIAFITDPAPIRKILTCLGEPLEPPPLAPARGPPTSWDEILQVHDDRDATQASPDDLPVIDISGL